MSNPIEVLPIQQLPILEIASIVASLVSVALAIFAIWLSLNQRQESQNAYDKTKDVLSELDKVMKSTETLVSDNFQNLLKSITDQQGQMLEAMKPQPSQEIMMSQMLINLAQDDPDKLEKVAEAMAKFRSLSP